MNYNRARYLPHILQTLYSSTLIEKFLPSSGKTALSKAAVRCLRENHGGTLVRLTVAKIAAPTVEAAIQNVKSTFALAEKNRPSIVVIEELETLLPRHSTPNDEFGEIQRQIARLNDGTGVIILGITKHPDLLHPIALQR